MTKHQKGDPQAMPPTMSNFFVLILLFRKVICWPKNYLTSTDANNWCQQIALSEAPAQPFANPKWLCLWMVDFLGGWFIEEKLDYLTGNLILKPCLVLQTFKMHIFRRLISLSVIITRPCWLLFPTNSQLPFRVRCSFIRFMGKMCPALFMAKKTTLTALNVTFVEGLSTFLSLFFILVFCH